MSIEPEMQSQPTPAQECPSSLYKYRSLSNGALEFVRRIFIHNEVYLASRTTFNDPFDSRARFSLEGTKSQHRAYFERVTAKRLSHMKPQERRTAVKQYWKERDQYLPEAQEATARDLNARLDNEMGIFCLSARPDHILLWSHYADCHRGVCLRFDCGPNSSFSKARQVHYQPEYPVCRIVSGKPEENVKAMIYTKAIEWAYEEEWRIHDASGPGPKPIVPEMLTGVILGARISDVDRAAVVSWARTREAPCEILQADLAEARYEVVVSAY